MYTKAVKNLLDSSGIRYIYLPPYSPDPNPIEKLRSKVKVLLHKFKLGHWRPFLMQSIVLFRLFLLLTAQVVFISAAIRHIFLNRYNCTLLKAKINALWAIAMCDGCTSLRSVEKAFCKIAQPASVRCSSRVWVFPNKHFATQKVFLYRRKHCLLQWCWF